MILKSLHFSQIAWSGNIPIRMDHAVTQLINKVYCWSPKWCTVHWIWANLLPIMPHFESQHYTLGRIVHPVARHWLCCVINFISNFVWRDILISRVFERARACWNMSFNFTDKTFHNLWVLNLQLHNVEQFHRPFWVKWPKSLRKPLSIWTLVVGYQGTKIKSLCMVNAELCIMTKS